MKSFFPTELMSELNASYSVAIYGQPWRLPHLTELRVLWPNALSAAANASLATALWCNRNAATSASLETHTYLFMDGSLINHAAVWVHQPGHGIVPAVASFSWVEVTHCAYRSRVEGTTGMTPMFFWNAPGSGISVNVGRTLVIRSDPGEKLRVALARGYINRGPTMGRTFGRNKILRAFGHNTTPDSVQFINWREAPTSRSHFNDMPNLIVMLKWGCELHLLTKHLEHVRCGRVPDLRACRPTDAAVMAHGPACMQRTTEWALCPRASVRRAG